MTEPAPSKGELLLVIATELFAERGIAAVSVDMILTRAEVATPTLYRSYRGGKPELVVASLRQWSANHLARLRGALAAGGDAHDRLDRLFAFLTDWSGEPGFRGSYIMNAAAELAAVEALNRDAAREARTVIEDHQRQEHALLAELARPPQVRDPDGLADEFQLILYGAIDRASLAAPDQRPLIAETAKAIARAMLEQAIVTTPVEQ
jgi:AcrR family transcriptional regulator